MSDGPATQADERMPTRMGGDEARPTLITGGAGFVGTNLAARLLDAGQTVRIVDSLARPGVGRNLEWLRETFGNRVQAHIGDVRDGEMLREAVDDARQVFHLAAQVAVTTGLRDPVADFEVNLRGTLNLLEAIRAARRPPPLLFTSTNKVYGALEDIELQATDSRYQPVDPELRARGVGADRPLDFHSPYGCSKGGADQYVLDYARSYGLRTAVFRMSCIYGPHQFGTEDQGWVAHFLIRALQDAPITLFGDGRQVRDILFVEDLVEAMLRAQQAMQGPDAAKVSGRAFNIGGGAGNSISLRELLQRIGELTGRTPTLEHADWRTGDQRYYVSDIRAFAAATGWQPRTSIDEGLQRLHGWLRESRAAGGPAERPARTAAA